MDLFTRREVTQRVSRHVTVLSRVLFGGVDVDEGLLCDAWAKIYANIQ